MALDTTSPRQEAFWKGRSLAGTHRRGKTEIECSEDGYQTSTRRAERGVSAGPASRPAIRPATRASLTMSAVFARTEAPSVSSAMRARSQGVSAGPRMPAASASRAARSSSVAGDVVGEGRVRRDGHADDDARRRARGPRWAAARSAAAVHVGDAPRAPGCPRSGRRSPGRSSWPTATTGTPRVSRYSSVAGDVEDRLRAGAHDDHRRPGELLEVGGDVEGRGLGHRRSRARRDGRRRSRPWRRPGSRPRGRRSSWPRPSWPTSLAGDGRREARPGGLQDARPSGAVASASSAAVVEAHEDAGRRGSRPSPARRPHRGRRPRRRGQPRCWPGTAGRG